MKCFSFIRMSLLLALMGDNHFSLKHVKNVVKNVKSVGCMKLYIPIKGD